MLKPERQMKCGQCNQKVEYAGKGECLLNKNQMSASIQFDLIKNNYKQFKKCLQKT